MSLNCAVIIGRLMANPKFPAANVDVATFRPPIFRQVVSADLPRAFCFPKIFF